MRSESAKYGHVKRQLLKKERLTGKVLETALDLVGQGDTGDSLMDGIATKLIAGQQLSDYDAHLMIDVFLLHARLAGGTPINASTPPEIVASIVTTMRPLDARGNRED